VTLSSWLNFGRPAPPGRGSAAGRIFLALLYYSQRAVFASLWAHFSLLLDIPWPIETRFLASDSHILNDLSETCSVLTALNSSKRESNLSNSPHVQCIFILPIKVVNGFHDLVLRIINDAIDRRFHLLCLSFNETWRSLGLTPNVFRFCLFSNFITHSRQVGIYYYRLSLMCSTHHNWQEKEFFTTWLFAEFVNY